MRGCSRRAMASSGLSIGRWRRSWPIP
eukprot:jgi/Mesen1/7526/ME000391S06766